MGKYLFKVSKIALEQRFNVILQTLNRYFPTGNALKDSP